MSASAHPSTSVAIVGVIGLLLALLPAALDVPGASAQTAADAVAPAGALGADVGRSNLQPGAGPVLPGPEHLVAHDVVDTTTRDKRLIADGRGNLLLQGRAAVGGDDVQRLASFEAATGALSWSADDIADGCAPVVAPDGRIFAQLVANSAGSGVDNFSADPVELDPADGSVVNRYTSPDTDAEPRIRECEGGLNLTADGVLLMVVRGDGYDVVGVDTTTTPMRVAFRTPLGDGLDGLDVVLSPDTTSGYAMTAGEVGGQKVLTVSRLDAATGTVEQTTTVPGTQGWNSGNLRHTGELLLAFTEATGGADDPARVIALDPLSLDEVWTISARDAELLEPDGDDGFGEGGAAVTATTLVINHADRLLGFDLDTGAPRWTRQLSSFSNNGSQVIADAAGRVYTSTFGGSPIEVVDGRSGELVFRSPEVEDFYGDAVTGEAQSLGPILDGVLHVTVTRSDDSRPVLVALGNGRARLDGEGGDIIDVAIQLCRYLFADGGARTVVLSRDDVFADTLAAAPLAGDDSCILFTAGGPDQPVDPRTLAEIQRVLPAGGTVRIAGGPDAVSTRAQAAIAGEQFVVQRLAGPGRVETAVEIGRVVVAEHGGAVDEAVIAFAGDWPDAATAGAAAASRGIPVLLSNTSTLPQQTADALSEFGVSRTFVAGGPAVVAESAAQAAPGPVRVAGDNRFGTAAEVARQMWDITSADRAFVFANLEFGQGWALALAASPLSVRIGAPQLGVTATRFPTETSDYLTERGVTDLGAFVLGDVSIISDEVVGQIEVAGG